MRRGDAPVHRASISSTGPTQTARPVEETRRRACTTRRSPAAATTTTSTAGPGPCSARLRSTCSAPSRASCRPSCMTCWPAPPTTPPEPGSPPRWPAAGPTPVTPRAPCSSPTRPWTARDSVGAPELLADCLDAALAAHWGPDELGQRRTLAARARRGRRARPGSRRAAAGSPVGLAGRLRDA